MASITFFEYPTEVFVYQLVLYYLAVPHQTFIARLRMPKKNVAMQLLRSKMWISRRKRCYPAAIGACCGCCDCGDCSVAWGSFVIGCFGVGGGAIFLPLMLFLPGMTPAVAIGTVFCGAVPMTVARNVQLMCYGHYQAREALPLVVGSVGGALAGQALVPHVPGALLAYLVAVLAVFAGVQTQRRIRTERRRAAAKAAAKAAEAKEVEPADADAAEVEAPPPPPPLPPPQLPPPQLPQPQLPPPLDTRGTGGCLLGMLSCFLGPLLGSELQKDKPPLVDVPVVDVPVVDVPVVDEDEEQATACQEEEQNEDARSCEAKRPRTRRLLPRSVHDCGIGVVASLFSSLSGTGGPLIIFPLWLLLHPNTDMKRIVGLSSPFAMSLVSFSAIGALLFGQVDLGLSAIFAVIGTSSAILGGMLMERMGDSRLKSLVSGVLIIIGLAVAVRTTVDIAT